ncbi:DUF3025 domain-containing protein [Paraglaciecola sp. MB-3u-78]|uniref:DUF3025 domain-containing protein n=1 Tax=Paraglaciecola sp. MB-3u-78 TaxID=2058332 RepID=UPI0018E2C2FB|nr:DUF3025 domain-containing protein [Paraglaciecola sp. MB-3u-78]
MTVWHHDFTQQLPMLPMQQLETYFGLSRFTDWPNAQGLNALMKLKGSLHVPNFICQSELAESDDYYEQIIHQQHIIPTRPNSWHDLFNGLIWLQFPQTKRLLNQQHVEDIEQYGLSPRTLRRNNLTHFDECGVIVTYERSEVFSQLIENVKQHQWHAVFVDNRQYWGNEINSFIFGHANLEMLLHPFIGLTGKFLAVEVDSLFSSLSYKKQVAELDIRLVSHIQKTDLFSTQKPLSPMPLLGIPDVWDANNDPEFYDNTDYFRPKPSPKSASKNDK